MQRFQLLRRRNVWQRVAMWDARTHSHASQPMILSRSFSALPDHEVVGLPALSPTMETGTIAKWMINEGEMVSAGDIICQVETDKAVVDFEAQDDLYLAKILKPEGSTDIQVGEPIFVSVMEQTDVAAFKSFSIENNTSNASKTVSAPAKSTVQEPKKEIATPGVPVQEESKRGATERVFASPLAKKLARESGVLLAAINGTGPRGRIVQADVQDAIARGTTSASDSATTSSTSSSSTSSPSSSTTSSSSDFTDYPISSQAQEYAQKLTQQKREVPHFHLSIDLTVDMLLQARERLNAGLGPDAQLSVYDFMIRAASLAMKQVPAVNSAWKGSFIRQYHDTNINVVVSTKQGGSIAPILKGVNHKGLSEISTQLQTMMATALDDKSFTSEQVETGTFTISNVGMYQIQSLAGIVSPEQACFLGLGGIEKKVVPNDDPNATQIYKYAHVLTATLACDHRVVDGAVGAQWLSVFKELVEDPLKMIL